MAVASLLPNLLNNYYMQTLTHHFIDDQVVPDIDGIEPWDLAVDRFRLNCHFPPHLFSISEDGKTMTFRMRGSRLGDNYERMARLIVLMHALPLEVTRDRFAVNDVVFEDNLLITYAAR